MLKKFFSKNVQNFNILKKPPMLKNIFFKKRPKFQYFKKTSNVKKKIFSKNVQNFNILKKQDWSFF